MIEGKMNLKLLKPAQKKTRYSTNSGSDQIISMFCSLRRVPLLVFMVQLKIVPKFGIA